MIILQKPASSRGKSENHRVMACGRCQVPSESSDQIPLSLWRPEEHWLLSSAFLHSFLVVQRLCPASSLLLRFPRHALLKLWSTSHQASPIPLSSSSFRRLLEILTQDHHVDVDHPKHWLCAPLPYPVLPFPFLPSWHAFWVAPLQSRIGRKIMWWRTMNLSYIELELLLSSQVWWWKEIDRPWIHTQFWKCILAWFANGSQNIHSFFSGWLSVSLSCQNYQKSCWPRWGLLAPGPLRGRFPNTYLTEPQARSKAPETGFSPEHSHIYTWFLVGGKPISTL